MRNPAALLLDEATSALDPATESAINATLSRLAVGRTVVTVTHRLAAARGDALAVRVRPHHLRSVPLLGGVEEAALAEVASRMVIENWDAGRVVMQAGEEGERFFVIARGRVEVTLQVGGTVRHIATLDDGDFFWE